MDSEKIKDWVQSIAIVGGGIWAVFAFVFEAPIKLRWEEPHIEVSSSLEVVGEQHGSIAGFFVKGSVRIENHSKYSVWIVGSLLETKGHEATKVAATDEPTDLVMNQKRSSSQRGLETFQWIKTLESDKTVAVGILREGLRISPREVFESDYITFVPATYDIASLEITLNYARKRKLHSLLKASDNSGVVELNSYLIEPDEELNQNDRKHQRKLKRMKFKQTQTRSIIYLRQAPPDCSGSEV